MSRLVASRIELQLTLLELDDNAEPLNEYAQQPVILFGATALQQWLDDLPARIADAQRQLDTEKGGAANGHDAEIRAAVPRRS
jgi:hypothetical protein